MDRVKVAQELVKVAKELVAGGMKNVIRELDKLGIEWKKTSSPFFLDEGEAVLVSDWRGNKELDKLVKKYDLYEALSLRGKTLALKPNTKKVEESRKQEEHHGLTIYYPVEFALTSDMERELDFDPFKYEVDILGEFKSLNAAKKAIKDAYDDYVAIDEESEAFDSDFIEWLQEDRW